MVEPTSKDEEIKVDEKFLLIITNSILANKVYETEALTGLANDQVVVFQREEPETFTIYKSLEGTGVIMTGKF